MTSANKNELDLLAGRVKEQIDKGLDRYEIVEQTTYVDHVHSRYPEAFSEHFENLMKKSIGRLYDELV
jgi:hypothetical protein